MGGRGVDRPQERKIGQVIIGTDWHILVLDAVLKHNVNDSVAPYYMSGRYDITPLYNKPAANIRVPDTNFHN